MAALGWLLNLDMAGSVVVATAVAREGSTVAVFEKPECVVDDDGRGDITVYPEV